MGRLLEYTVVARRTRIDPLRAPGFVLVIAIALSIGSAAHAQAAPNAQNDATYDSLIDNALSEYRLGHWVEAKAYFTQAHALQPNARTLRGLGLVCYELRKYVEAIAYFQQSLASQTRPLTDSMRDGVSQLLHDAQRFVSRVDVQITPPDATLTLDGRVVTRDAEGQILIDAGSHELTVEAAGYDGATRNLTTDGGESMRVKLALRPNQAVGVEAPAPGPIQSQPPAAGDASDSDSESVAPWIVVAGGGVVLITGGVLLGVALSDKSDIEDTPKGSRSWSEVESAYDRVPVMSTIGSILIGVGAAGVAAGLAWKFWPDESGEQASAALRPLPGGLKLDVTF
jgi:PEGA domain-containing protein